MLDRPNTVIALPAGLARRSHREGVVERACAAFLAEHAAMVAFIGGYDDAESLNFKPGRSLRDGALGEVRTHVAQTASAVSAKNHVLTVIRDWFEPDDSDVSAFAAEIAAEATALLATDPAAWRASDAFHREAVTITSGLGDSRVPEAMEQEHRLQTKG